MKNPFARKKKPELPPKLDKAIEKIEKPYKPMMVVDLMNDLERDNNFKERIKQQLSKPIQQQEQWTGNDAWALSGIEAWSPFVSSPSQHIAYHFSGDAIANGQIQPKD